MASIQHDPARRIRRIRRLHTKPFGRLAYRKLPDPFELGPERFLKELDKLARLKKSADLLAVELAWLCGYAEERANLAEQYRADSMRNNETIRLYRERFAPRSILDVYDGNGD